MYVKLTSFCMQIPDEPVLYLDGVIDLNPQNINEAPTQSASVASHDSLIYFKKLKTDPGLVWSHAV